MQLFKNKSYFINVIVIICILLGFTKVNTLANPDPAYDYRKLNNVAVIINSLSSMYNRELITELQNLENENKDKIKLTIFDVKNNIRLQYATIDSIMNSNFDLIMGRLADTSEEAIKDLLLRAKNKGIPIALLNVEPEIVNSVSKYYDKAVFVAYNTEANGMAQGKMIADYWYKNQHSMDKNGDGILQYILVTASTPKIITEEGVKSILSTINSLGVKTEELQVINGGWSQEIVKTAIENAFIRFDANIEAIIAINDNFAIGAVEGLQKYGYNTGDKNKTIPVFGFYGTTEAINLIDKGMMAGTIIQDPKEIAKEFFTIAMNLVENRAPLENVNYALAGNEVVLKVNLREYTKNM